MGSDDDNRWRDPLLLTDVSRQQQQQPPPFPKQQHCISFDCRAMLGNSLSSPDMVICANSPLYTPTPSYEDSPECLRIESKDEKPSSIVLSLDEGINGLTSNSSESSTKWQAMEQDALAEDSFELAPRQTERQEVDYRESVPIMSINCGSEDKETDIGGISFLQDCSYDGGDVIRTNADVGEGEGKGAFLYQTARFGKFSYNFQFLEPGKYIVDLHFAEIVFTDGPPGMRVFDVYVQGAKAVSSLDIYANVGANRPLVVSGLQALVEGDEGLSVTFDGLMGNPLISGISVRKELPKDSESIRAAASTKLLSDDVSIEDIDEVERVGDIETLSREYENQRRELEEARMALEELKRDNQIKEKERREACLSLQELQNELMRKSMHVGSLAFAVEGQVKEKSKWFSALSDLKRRLKILKVEQLNLSDEARKCKLFVADIDGLSFKIQSALNEQGQFSKELEFKFIEGEKERKNLYNKVLELKGNIRVFCRCRPLNADETVRGASAVVDFQSAKDGELSVRSNGCAKKSFKFDAVFGPQSDQADVFEDTAPFASSVLDGYNVCIFAYGQTGTGKTYTMEGTEEARGVNYRTLEKMFDIIEEQRKLFRYEISVSVLEVYNEQIRDLLAPISQPGVASKKLEIRQGSEGMHHIPGLVEAQVSNIDQVWDVLRTGSNARAVGSTNANEHSSRSHCIHCVMVKGENLLSGECTKSKLWLVDLAGSERISKTEVQGDRLREAQNINKSLSALGDVISSLASKTAHVPFRNSKLTHLLQDSLGGDSKTLMFVQISPSENDVSETLCSLNFASRVKGIEFGPAKKQFDCNESLKYKQMVDKTKQEVKSKEDQIKRMEDAINNLEMKVKDKDLKNKSLQDKVKELEAQLLIERKIARQHVHSQIAERQQTTRQVLEEQSNHQSTRPPLIAKPLLGCVQIANDASNLSCPTEQNNTDKVQQQSSFPPEKHGFSRHAVESAEKENNPMIVKQQQLMPSKRTGRVSLGPVWERPVTTPAAARRDSMIPVPGFHTAAAAQVTPLKPLTPFQEVNKREKEDGLDLCSSQLDPTTCGSKLANSEGKVLKRTLSRIRKSPLQQNLRRGAVKLGTEKVRLSITNRGRLMGNRAGQGSRRTAAATGTGEVHQKQAHKKERGWNI